MPLFPAGWGEAFREEGAVDVVEYVPQGQTAVAWSDKIVLQVYHGLDALPLDAIQRRAQGQNRAACTGVIEGPLQSGLNNGYASGFWTLGCRRHKQAGQGETRYSKAIQGDNALYVITRAWRTPPFGDEGPAIAKDAVDEAVAFLTTSTVCVPGSSAHPCPAE